MLQAAIVILNWNGLEFLEKFLPILIKKSSVQGVEIIVADNNSSDESLSFIEKNHPEIRTIKLDDNYGFAGGYNKALEKVNAEYYLLLNSDIEVGDKWIEPLIDFMDKNPKVAACSPIILDFNKRDYFEYAGAAGGYIDKFGYTFCRGRIFNTLEVNKEDLKNPLEVFWTSGACMLIRSELFKKTGGFDSHFFAHMEEVDLCWRLKNLGHTLAVVPESRVYHIGGGTLPKSNPFKTYLNFRNNLLMLYKNLPEQSLSKTVFIRKLMDGLSAGLFLLSLKFKDIAAIYKAHRSFEKDKANYDTFRNEQDKLHAYPEHKEIYQKSIVLDYFLLGRKKFNTLRDGFSKKTILKHKQ